MVDVYSRIVRDEFGGNVTEWVAGGLTDGNRTAKYIPTLDALGVENYDEHTDHESVDLKTAVPDVYKRQDPCGFKSHQPHQMRR